MFVIVIKTIIALEMFIWPLIYWYKYCTLNVPFVRYKTIADPMVLFNDHFIAGAKNMQKYINVHDLLRAWFRNSCTRDITRQDMCEIIASGFWLKKSSEGGLPDLLPLVDAFEKAWDFEFKRDELQSRLPLTVDHLWRPIRCEYRPFAFFAMVECFFFVKHVWMLRRGFKCYTHKGILYYVFIDAESTTLPVTLFIHGLGLGLYSYRDFIMQLGRPLIAVEVPHLGMRWTRSVPTEEEVTQDLLDFLKERDIQKVNVVAHSYGTFYASLIAQRNANIVRSFTLIDPVCFLMFNGKLVNRFVFDVDTASTITRFLGKTVNVAAAVCRTMFWTELNMWARDIPAKTLVVLSGMDVLVPVKEIAIMLECEAPHVHVMLNPDHEHAGFLGDIPWQKKIVSNISNLSHHK